MRQLASLFLTLLLCVSAVAEQDFVHKETKLSFPPTSDSFQLGSIRDMTGFGLSFIVSYGSDKTDTAVTIYLNNRPGTLEEQIADVQHSIEAMNPSAKLLASEDLKVGARVGKARRYRLKVMGDDSISEARVYLLEKGYRMKVRATGPYSQRKTILSQLDRLLTTILSS